MAGGNWTQLTISLATFDRLARSPAGLWVLSMVNCDDKAMDILGALTKSPSTGGPPQPRPPNTRNVFAKPLGAIFPALDRQGTVCSLRSSVDLANRSSFEPVTTVPPPLERR